MEFLEALTHLGFDLSQDRPSRGLQTYSASPNRYLTYWVHVYEDGSALFTWEFAITDYLLEKGIQLGSSETLNTFMFPVEDQRGPQEAAWLAHVIETTEARLRGLDLANPES
ncbi:MAG TPA: hypothetical protein VEQ37_07005 [Actinomycetota bacterium]|nr:hypothetical protein [Actinomycetota bacterium]